MSKKLTLKAKLVSYRSLPKFVEAHPEEISKGIKRLEDFGLTPANMHPMASLSDRGRSTLRYSVAEVWSARQKLDFLKRSGLLPAALEMERRAFRKALQIKKMDGPRDRDLKYMQREKNRPKGASLPKVVGEDFARFIQQLYLLRTRPVSVYRLRPVHSNEDLLPKHITMREKESNRSFTELTKRRLEALDSHCTSVMSPVKKVQPRSADNSPAKDYKDIRRPVHMRVDRLMKRKIQRIAQSLNI